MVFLIMFITVSSVPALSEDETADTMQLVREKIKADKKLLVAMNMKLTETEAEKFWPLYEEHQKSLKTVNMRFSDLIDKYASIYPEITDEIAGSLLDNYLSIENHLFEVRKSYLPKFREILPAAKVARYYQIENKIMAVIRYDAAANIPLM
jgi:uncharacterized protein (DUF342 family)